MTIIAVSTFSKPKKMWDKKNLLIFQDLHKAVILNNKTVIMEIGNKLAVTENVIVAVLTKPILCLFLYSYTADYYSHPTL